MKFHPYRMNTRGIVASVNLVLCAICLLLGHAAPKAAILSIASGTVFMILTFPLNLVFAGLSGAPFNKTAIVLLLSALVVINAYLWGACAAWLHARSKCVN